MPWLPNPPHATESAPPASHPQRGSAFGGTDSAGLASTAPAASSGRRIHSWVNGDAGAVREVGKSRRVKEGLPGIQAVPERGLLHPQAHVLPMGSRSTSYPTLPLPVPSLLRAKGTGSPMGTGGPAHPPAPWILSPQAGGMSSPLFGKKKQPLPSHKKERPLKTSSRCISSLQQRGFFKQIPA